MFADAPAARSKSEMKRARYQGTNWSKAGSWVARTLRADFSVFEEVRADPSVTIAAIAAVLGASLLAGVGSWLWAAQHEFIDSGKVFLESTLAGSIVQTAAWFLWVYLVYQVLVRGYGARVEFAELVRVMGFAFTPVALNILVAVTSLAVPFGIIAFSMAVLFTNIAIQQAVEVDAREATLANLTGFAAFAIAMGVLANVWEVDALGGLAPGVLFFALDI